MAHRRHYILHALAIGFAVALLALGLTGTFTQFGQPAKPAPVTAHDELHASYAAQATPVIDCSPPVPARLGQCAPTVAFQGLNAAGNLVNDPYAGSASGLLVPDVSHYTACGVNAAAMKRDGARALIVALGDGPGYADPCAHANIAAGRAAQLPIGTYLFFRPSPSASPEGQADRMHALAAAAGGSDMPEWIDAEAGIGLSQAGECSWLTRAADRVEANTRRAAGVYTGAWWMDPNVGACAALSHSPLYGPRPLWISGYGVAPLIPLAWHGVTHDSHPYALWQYTGDGLGPLYPHGLGGYNGIDISVYSGTSAQLAAFTSTSPPTPPPTAAQVARCGTLRWLRTHGQRGTPAEGDVRNSLVADRVACPDHTAIHAGPAPKVPQPSPDEFRMCRTLLAWRRSGRPPNVRRQAASDRAQLVHAGVRCNGRPPLIAVRG